MPQSPESPAQRSPFVRTRFVAKRIKHMQSKSLPYLNEDENKENQQHNATFPHVETDFTQVSNKLIVGIDQTEHTENLQIDDKNKNDCIFDFEKSQRNLILNNIGENVSGVDETRTAANEDTDLQGFQVPQINSSYLLEEIDHCLTIKPLREMSKIGNISIDDYRTRSRLCRIMSFAPYSLPLKNTDSTPKTEKFTLKQELDRLKIELRVQEMLAEQAHHAIQLCTNKSSSTYLDKEKMLLLASIKHRAVKNEIQRLLKLAGQNNMDSGCGYLSLNEVLISMNKSSLDSYSSYNFICVAVERDNVRASGLVTACNDGEITFNNKFHFLYLKVHFKVSISIYAIPNKESKSRLFLKPQDLLKFSPKTKPSKSDYEIPHNFILISSTDICFKDITGSNYMYLTTNHKHGQSIKAHLKGDVHLSMFHEGLLTIKSLEIQDNDEDIAKDELSVWETRWYKLTGLGLQGWNYPFQPEKEVPCDYINLTYCMSHEVEAVDPFLCTKKFTFTFVIKQPNQKQRRIYCSTDTFESYKIWKEKVNIALKTLRAWDQSVYF